MFLPAGNKKLFAARATVGGEPEKINALHNAKLGFIVIKVCYNWEMITHVFSIPRKLLYGKSFVSKNIVDP
jgi:hypothetical protein